MTTVTFYQNHDSICVGFRSEGHAGYAEAGEDIVCAAVSALVITAVNSLEKLTDDEFISSEDEENAVIQVSFPGTPGKEASLLMEALKIGLQGICAV